jgi:hypothetical protein
MTSRLPSMSLLIAGVVAISGAVVRAQSPPSPTVAEVRTIVDAARKAVDAYAAAGGVPGGAQHPAIEWEARLWALRERDPRSDAASLAASEAVWMLVRAELWDRVHARIASIGYDDPAWSRLAGAIYSEGIARKDPAYAIASLSRAAASTTTPSIKAAVLVTLGRAHKRAGDLVSATAALEAAKAAAPGSPQAEDADGLIYEIKYLSPGLPAPPVAGRSRNRGPIDLAALRGKAVVLVFWGST